MLRARLRSAEDEIDSVRRETLLEGRARSVAEMAEAGKRDAAFRAEVEALQLRCEDQASLRTGHGCTLVHTRGYESCWALSRVIFRKVRALQFEGAGILLCDAALGLPKCYHEPMVLDFGHN